MKPSMALRSGVAVICAGLALIGCGKEQPSTASKSPPPAAQPASPTDLAPVSTQPAPPRGLVVTPPQTSSTTDRPTNVRPTTQPATAPANRPAITSQPPSTPPEDSKTAKFAGLSAPKPVTWLWQPSTSKMSLADYVVPGREGADQARIAVFSVGGTIDENITRWKTQFRNTTGGPVEPKSISNLEADGMPITLVEFAGEYRGMGGAYTPDQLFLVAIVQAPAGQIFVRFVGPTATVEANREPFMAMIRGIKEAEAEK